MRMGREEMSTACVLKLTLTNHSIGDCFSLPKAQYWTDVVLKRIQLEEPLIALQNMLAHYDAQTVGEGGGGEERGGGEQLEQLPHTHPVDFDGRELQGSQAVVSEQPEGLPLAVHDHELEFVVGD